MDQPPADSPGENGGSSSPKEPLDLRTEPGPARINADAKRFDMFLIDTGWNKPVSEVVRSHLPILHEFQRQDSLYLLTPEQSVEILRKDPGLIGRDPTLLVYDQFARRKSPANRYQGFRIHLGRFKSGQQAMVRLQEFLRFVNMNRTADDLDRAVRAELHREGFAGAVKILREASAASIELI